MTRIDIPPQLLDYRRALEAGLGAVASAGDRVAPEMLMYVQALRQQLDEAVAAWLATR